MIEEVGDGAVAVVAQPGEEQGVICTLSTKFLNWMGSVFPNVEGEDLLGKSVVGSCVNFTFIQARPQIRQIGGNVIQLRSRETKHLRSIGGIG